MLDTPLEGMPARRWDDDKMMMSLETGKFQGGLEHAAVICATLYVRGELEDVHCGRTPWKDAVVRWPGGSQPFSQVARLTDSDVARLARTMVELAADEFAKVVNFVYEMTPRDFVQINFKLGMAKAWLLPRFDEAEVQRLIPIAKEATFQPAGKRRSLKETARRILKVDRAMEKALERFARGNPEPALAAARGERVIVEDGDEILEWDDVSAINDVEMAKLNIAMSDYLMSMSEAMDEVRGYRGPHLPTPFDIMAAEDANAYRETIAKKNARLDEIEEILELA